MIKHVTVWLPAPFHRVDCVVIERLDGEDDEHRYYATDLFIEDRSSDTGLRLMRSGPRRAVMKFVDGP